MKQIKQAKVVYNEANDSFELWLRTSPDVDWGFSCSAKCYTVKGDAEANHIHFSFMKEVVRCAELGYEVFMGAVHD